MGTDESLTPTLLANLSTLAPRQRRVFNTILASGAGVGLDFLSRQIASRTDLDEIINRLRTNGLIERGVFTQDQTSAQKVFEPNSEGQFVRVTSAVASELAPET